MKKLYTHLLAGASLALCHADHVESMQQQPQLSIHEAAERGEQGALQNLIDARADVNELDSGAMSPLYCAIEGRKAGALNVLLAAGARTDLQYDQYANALEYAQSIRGDVDSTIREGEPRQRATVAADEVIRLLQAHAGPGQVSPGSQHPADAQNPQVNQQSVTGYSRWWLVGGAAVALAVIALGFTEFEEKTTGQEDESAA